MGTGMIVSEPIYFSILWFLYQCILAIEQVSYIGRRFKEYITFQRILLQSYRLLQPN